MVISGLTQLQIELNKGKEDFIDALVRKCVIDKEVGENLKKNYILILHKKNWLGRTIDKLYGLDDNSCFIQTVKLV